MAVVSCEKGGKERRGQLGFVELDPPSNVHSLKSSQKRSRLSQPIFGSSRTPSRQRSQQTGSQQQSPLDSPVELNAPPSSIPEAPFHWAPTLVHLDRINRPGLSSPTPRSGMDPPPSFSVLDVKKDKRRAWAAAKTFIQSKSQAHQPPTPDSIHPSSLAVPSPSSSSRLSSSPDRASLNTSANSRTSEDSGTTVGEDSIRLVRRSAVKQRQPAGSSARRASGAGGGHAARSATEEFARQLDGVIGSLTVEELPKVIEAEEQSDSLLSLVTSSHESPGRLQAAEPLSLSLESSTGPFFDSPISESFPSPQPRPPLLSPSRLRSPPASTSARPRLTLPALNTNTIYLCPPSKTSPQPSSPSQAQWKTVRDVVVGTASQSASSTPSPSPGVALEGFRRLQEESYPPDKLDRERGASRRQGGSAEERERGFFTKSNKAGGFGGFRGVADQAMQSLATGRNRERGKSTATVASSLSEAPDTSTIAEESSALRSDSTRRMKQVHPQYLRFEHEIASALKQERRNRLLSTLCSSALASQLGVPAIPSSAFSSNTSFSNTQSITPNSQPTHSSSRPSFTPLSATTPYSSASSRNSTLLSGFVPPLPSSIPPPLSALLQVLHVYVPYAPQPWAQPLPCASEVLFELGRPFATGGGEAVGDQNRGMSFEVFTMVVKYWRSETKEEEEGRWRWCLRAMENGDDGLRSRALPLLLSLLSPTSPTAPIPTHPLSMPPTAPLALQSLVLFLLRLARTVPRTINPLSRAKTEGGARIFAIQSSPSELSEKQSIERLVSRARRGEVVKLEKAEVEEIYGVTYAGAWDVRKVSEAVVWEGIVAALSAAEGDEWRELLEGDLQTFWPELFPSDQGTLAAEIHRRALLLFVRTTRSFFLQPLVIPDPTSTSILEQNRLFILNIVRKRVLPQLNLLATSSASGEDDATLATSLMGLLLALSAGADKPIATEDEMLEERATVDAWALVDELLASGYAKWKLALSSQLREIVASQPLAVVEPILRLVTGQDAISGLCGKDVIHALFERLLLEPSDSRSTLLPLLLDLQNNHLQLFYRPLFGCASSDKIETVLHNRAILAMLVEVVGVARFWLKDAEMMAMAVAGRGKITGGTGALSWAKAKLGQLVALLDLTEAIRGMSKEEKYDETELRAHSKFLESLEARIAVLIEATERTILLPFSHRSLIASLFFEIRSFTQSHRRAPWMQRVVSWACESYSGAVGRPAPLPLSPTSPSNNPFLDPAPPQSTETLEVDEMILGELALSLHRVRAMSEPSVAGVSAQARSAKRETTTLVDLISSSSARPPSTRPQPKRSQTSSSAVVEQKDVSKPFMKLLVAVYSLLSMQDLLSLGPVIYQHHLEGEWNSLGPAVFLFSLAAEKTPSSLSAVIASDAQSLDFKVKLALLSRLSTLYSWRTRVSSQPYIPDRQRRRPFKTTKEVVPFIPTNVGLGKYLPAAAQDATYLRFGGSLPFAVRARLMALGWDTDQKEESSRSDWERTPVSLLSGDLIESYSEIASTSPLKAVLPDRPNGSLARRRSAGQDTTSQPPVFSSLFVILLGQQFSALTPTSDGLLAAAGRETLFTLSREDASLIARPLVVALTPEGPDGPQILSTLRNLIFAQHELPPAFAHFLCNHLIGALKGYARVDSGRSLEMYSLILPLIAALGPQVTELSIRELKRSKADLLCLPTGAFWFDEAAPRLPMFPRQLTTADGEGESPGLHEMVAIRTSQNLLLLAILKKDRKEAYAVKKTISSFLLPRVLRGNSRSSRTYIPERQTLSDGNKAWVGQTGSASAERERRAASRLLSRSWLLVVHQLFLSLSRNYADRVELAHSLEGVNEILFAHWDDALIVGHALQIFMTASTRFLRLFKSASAFALILPPLFLAYAQAESIPAIRNAIEYGLRRLFNVHVESLVFQSIASISTILLHKEVGDDEHRRWISRNLFKLLSSLGRDETETAGRAVGIQDLNQDNEREALISLVNDAPEIILSDLRNGSRTEEEISSVVTTKWEEKTFPLEDVVRLFLTVIAHDPSSSRAESFLRVLQHLAVDLVGAGTAGDVLRAGVEALGQVFIRAPGKKIDGRTTGEAVVSWNELDHALLPGQSEEVDWLSMRLDYLLLVQAFAVGGGRLSGAGMRRTLEMVPGLLRESGTAAAEPAAAFLREFTRTSLLEGDAPSLKGALAYLRDLAPLVRGYADLVDFSGCLDAIGSLLQHPHLRSEPTFAVMVINDFVLPSLQTCSMSAAAGMLFSLPIRTATVNLLARSVFLSSSDVIANVEREPGTPVFLAGIVLPLVLALKSSSEIQAEHPRARQEIQAAHARAYIQLLHYTLASVASPSSTTVSKGEARPRGRSTSSSPSPARNVLSKASSSPEPRRRRQSDESSLGEGSSSSQQRSAATVVVALEIAMAILVKASDDLSRHSGIFLVLGNFLRTLLDSGDGRSLLGGRRSSFHHGTSSSSSRGGSPTPYGRAHERTLSGASEYTAFGGGRASPGMPQSTLTSQRTPSILDASMWLFFEFLVSFSTPLFLILRPWVRAKVGQQFEFADFVAGGAGRSGSPSSFTPTRLSMGGARRLSSNFARDGSPLKEGLRFADWDQAGNPWRRGSADGGGRHARTFSTSSSGRPSTTFEELSSRHLVGRPSIDGQCERTSSIDHYPQIRLVPLLATRSNTASSSTSSAILLAHAAAAKGLAVSSPLLVALTVRAVRVVEAAFGFASRGTDDSHEQDGPPPQWSKTEALARIVKVSKEWICGGEFEDVFDGDGGGEGW